MRARFLGVSCVLAMLVPASAWAQSSSPVLQGEIPFHFSRGRNVSVLERPRPEYRPTGIPAGGFTLLPSLDVSTGYTDNVYQQPQKTGDGFVNVNPEVIVNSNWSRHRLTATVGGNLQRYFNETLRNENSWYARLGGRYELGLDSVIDVTARAEKLYESRFSPSTGVTVQSSVPYRVNQVGVNVESTRGRFRFGGSASYENYDFKPVVSSTGTSLNQDNRDRGIATGSALVEYGVSPDTAVFAQLTYEDTNYGTDLAPGVANRDSGTTRGMVGVSLDLATLIRGRFGIGYMVRDYDSPLYTDVKGLAAEARLEYFLSPITTIGLNMARRADDSAITGTSGYISTSAALRIDHELLRNLILSGQLSYELGDYRGIDSKVNVFRATAAAQYLMTRNMSFRFDLGYGDRRNKGVPTGPEFDETRGQLTLQLHM